MYKKFQPVICLVILTFGPPFLSEVFAYDFPEYEGVSLSIRGNLSEVYDNNSTFSNDEENRNEEYRTMASLGIDAAYEGKRRSLSFSGVANRRIRFRPEDRANSSERVNVKFTNDFSPYDRLQISDNFTHTLNPGSFEDNFDINECRTSLADSGLTVDEIERECNRFEEEFGRFAGRFDSYSNNLGITYRKQLSEKLYANTKYNYGMNWSNQAGTTDSDSNSIGINGGYKFSESRVLTASYNYTITSYEGGDNIDRHSISTGIKQYITRRLYFNGTIGTDTVSTGDTNLNITAGLNGEIDPRTTANLRYSQGTRIDDNDEDTFKDWRIAFDLSRLLMEDLTSRYSVFYGQGDFVSSEITDTLTGASIRFTYRFWQGKRGSSIRGDLGYSYSNLDSTDEGRSYARNQITSTVVLAF